MEFSDVFGLRFAALHVLLLATTQGSLNSILLQHKVALLLSCFFFILVICPRLSCSVFYNEQIVEGSAGCCIVAGSERWCAASLPPQKLDCVGMASFRVKDKLRLYAQASCCSILYGTCDRLLPS